MLDFAHHILSIECTFIIVSLDALAEVTREALGRTVFSALAGTFVNFTFVQ